MEYKIEKGGTSMVPRKGVIIVSHEDEQDRLKNTARIISI